MVAPIVFNAEQATERARQLGFEGKAIHILSEIISTEMSYINAIGTLDDNVVKTCEALYRRQNLNDNDLNVQQFKVLVKNLQAIRQAQLGFLNSLLTDDPSLWNSKLEQLRERYINYTKVFDPTKNIPTEIKNVLEHFNKSGTPLDTIFIMPIQRIPRYNLLFGDLLKNTTAENPFYNEMSQMLPASLNLTADMNSSYDQAASQVTIGNPLSTQPNLPQRSPEQEQRLQRDINILTKDLILRMNLIKAEQQDPNIVAKMDYIIGTIENLAEKNDADRKVLFDLLSQNIIPNYFGKMSDPSLFKAIQKLVNDCKQEIDYVQTRHAEWVKKIRQYDVSQEAAIKAGETSSLHPFADKLRVDTILTTQESQDALYQGTYPADKEPVTARQAFLTYLDNRMLMLESQTTKPRPKITMEVLLGAEGLKLYKAAVAEEGKSRSYREAVFLKSFKHHEGASLDKRALLWVGGPSASGKTYAAEEVFKNICNIAAKEFDSLNKALVDEIAKLGDVHPDHKQEILYIINNLNTLNSSQDQNSIREKYNFLLENVNHLFKANPNLAKQMSTLLQNAIDPIMQSLTKGNSTIQVDGGIEREVSQMRQMVLEVALARGYCGISDLHDNTKLNAKDHIKRAALAQPGLSIVIPETFAESMLLKRFAPEGAYKQNEMNGYEQRDDLEQYFSEIIAEEGKEERFQTSVGHMGTSRAYLDDNLDFTEYEIAMNNRDLPCESKAYSPSGFWFGQMATSQARENFRKMNPQGWHIKVMNDLLFVKIENGKWQECNANDKPLFKLSNRDFQRWQAEKANNRTSLDLPAWYEEQKQQKKLAKPFVQTLPNDLMEVNTMEEMVGIIKISARDFDRWFSEMKQDPHTCPPLMQWCHEQHLNGTLITPADVVFQPIVRRRSRINSAPTPLEHVPAEDFKIAIQMPRSHSLGDVRNFYGQEQAATQARNRDWKNSNVSDRAINEMLIKVGSEQRKRNESIEQKIAAMPTVRALEISREDEFKNARAILESALRENPQLTSFKIQKKSHEADLNHSFICLRNKQGAFEIYRMAAEVLGKGTEGKFKVVEREDGAEFGVKISAVISSNNPSLAQREEEELKMMDDVGLLIGEFSVQREAKQDKTLNKTIGDKKYVVQQYIKGEDLSTLLAKQTLSEEQKLIILREVLANLKNLHDKGIIHRDIKPENIRVTLDATGKVKECTIIDFGVSVRAKLGESITRSYGGSPAFMAPEVGRREFQNEFSEYLKFSNQMNELQERRKLLTRGKIGPIFGLDRIDNQISQLQAKIDQQKEKYLAVLRQEYSYTSAVDTYAVGVIATKLGLKLGDYGLDGLTEDTPDQRMSAADALERVQNQITVLHAKKLASRKAPRKVTKDEAQVVEPVVERTKRLPPMVSPSHLNNINGKNLIITDSQMKQLKKFQSRGQRGLFEIEGKHFLIDNNLRLYAIFQPLAKGGMGSVSLGQDLENENWVAIKQSGDKLRRFGQSPYVVSILENENNVLQQLGQLVGVVSGVRGIVYQREEEHAISIQPFAFGDDYVNVMKKNSEISAQQSILMSLRLFEELDMMHENGILHLDIKPENLKWDSENNSCRILDVGTAVTKDKQQAPLLYLSEEVIGTEEFKAPELNQRLKPYSDKVDVYAAMLSLKKLLAKATGLNESERQLIDDFIKRGLSANPAERPTAAEAKAFFSQIAVKMQQEQRLSDVGVAIQIAQTELSSYIRDKGHERDQLMLNTAASQFLKSTHANLSIQDKIEIAKTVMEKINSLRSVELTSNQLTQTHFLALAEILIEARVNNIEDLDKQLEDILKKPSDQIILRFQQTLREEKSLTASGSEKENVNPQVAPQHRVSLTTSYKQSSTAKQPFVSSEVAAEQKNDQANASFQPNKPNSTFKK